MQDLTGRIIMHIRNLEDAPTVNDYLRELGQEESFRKVQAVAPAS